MHALVGRGSPVLNKLPSFDVGQLSSNYLRGSEKETIFGQEGGHLHNVLVGWSGRLRGRGLPNN